MVSGRSYKYLFAALIVVALAAASPAKGQSFADKVRTAPVTSKWNCALGQYTGGYYYVGHVNSLWPYAPRGSRRDVVLLESIRHRVPFRLMLGVWGAESSFGRAASHFGLTGYFPGRGTSGSFSWDAHLAAKLMDRLYRGCHGRSAL